jgi:opacity protein-like surface antigen
VGYNTEWVGTGWSHFKGSGTENVSDWWARFKSDASGISIGVSGCVVLCLGVGINTRGTPYFQVGMGATLSRPSINIGVDVPKGCTGSHKVWVEGGPVSVGYSKSIMVNGEFVGSSRLSVVRHR